MKEAHAAPHPRNNPSVWMCCKRNFKSGETSAEQLYARAARALAGLW